MSWMFGSARLRRWRHPHRKQLRPQHGSLYVSTGPQKLNQTSSPIETVTATAKSTITTNKRHMYNPYISAMVARPTLSKHVARSPKSESVKSHPSKFLGGEKWQRESTTSDIQILPSRRRCLVEQLHSLRTYDLASFRTYDAAFCDV